MNKYSIKKVVIFALLAIGMIACFASVPTYIQHNSNTSQEILDLGLEYKDGWYLINNEDDYYTMQHNWGNGIGADANYKLTSDISILASKSNELRAAETQPRAFNGNFDGDNYNIEMDLDVSQDEQVNAQATTGTYYYGTINGYSTKCQAFGAYSDVMNGGSVSRVRWTVNSTETVQKEVYSNENPTVAFGGLVGYAEGVSFSDCIVYIQNMYTVSWGVGYAETFAGGIAGIANDCYISRCFVRGFNYSGADYAGSIAGCMTGGSISNTIAYATYDSVGQYGYDYPSEDFYYSSSLSNFQVGGAVRYNVSNLATDISDVPGSEWVLIDDINGGEIIQTVFCNLYTLRVYNIMYNGAPSSARSSSTYIISGMSWSTIIDNLSASGGLTSNDKYTLKGLENKQGEILTLGDYRKLGNWGGSDYSFYGSSSLGYYLNAVWEEAEEELYYDTIDLYTKGGTVNSRYNPGPNCSYANSTNGIAITYQSYSTVVLPTASEMYKSGYKFLGWEEYRIASAMRCNYDSNGYVISVETGSTGRARFDAVWEETETYFDIQLRFEGGTLSASYSPGVGEWVAGSSSGYTYLSSSDVGSTITLPSSSYLSRSGYILVGWRHYSGTKMTEYTNDDGYVNQIKISSANSSAYSAVWMEGEEEEEEYYIRLRTDGGTLSNSYRPGVGRYSGGYIYFTKSDVGKSITLPTSSYISRSGYTFLGWEHYSGTQMTETTSGGYVTKITIKSASNSQYIAVWEEEEDVDDTEYCIRLEANGGTINEYYDEDGYANGKITYDSSDLNRKIQLPISSFIERSGYKFLGWQYYSGTRMEETTSGGYVTFITINSLGNSTYRAVWEQYSDECTVLLYHDGGTLSSDYRNNTPGLTYVSRDSLFYEFKYDGSTYFELPTSSDMTKDGYVFLGWRYSYTDAGSVTGGGDGTYVTYITSGSGEVIFTAKWEVGNTIYTITLDTKGGSISSSYDPDVDDYTPRSTTIKYTKNDGFYLPNASEMDKTGYTFVGWVYSSQDSNVDVTIVGGYATYINEGSEGNCGFYAVWKTISYTITLLPNSGTIKDYNPTAEAFSNNKITYSIESQFNLPTAGQTTRTGYRIISWKLTSTAGNWGSTNTNYGVGAPISGKYGTVTLQAVWELVDYTITLIPANGEIKDYNPTAKAFSNNKITYNIESQFNLPTASQIIRNGYTISSWKLTSTAGNWGSTNTNYGVGAPISGKYGTVTLQAVWELVDYTITLIPANGEIKDYNPTAEAFSNNKITYNIENEFDLPTASQIIRTGYTISSWKLTSTAGNWGSTNTNYGVGAQISGKYGTVTLQAVWELVDYTITLITADGEIKDYNPTAKAFSNNKITYNIENVFKLPSRYEILRTGFTATEWELTKKLSTSDNWGNVGNMYTQGQQVSQMYGDVELTAIWTENEYNIMLHSNNQTGITKSISPVKYSEDVQISWQLDYTKHVFVGWATKGYQTTQTYSYVDTNFTTSNIVGEYGTKILQDGKYVSKLTEGDLEGTQTISIYAIWLPIYDVTIESNGANLYENGIKVNKQNFVVENHFYKEYLLYSQMDAEVFETPADIEGVEDYRLHYYGYYINGWIIKAEGLQYYVPSSSFNPSYTQWEYTDDVTKMVNSGTNLQYLQGNIVAIPQWKALTFDVRFVTKGNEAYKSNYDYEYVSSVVYDANYIINISTNITRPADTAIVKAEDILGYSVIYAHPYNANRVDESITISLQNKWNYKLAYKQYSINDAYSKDTGWYIIIEGYYSPDLYRLRLDLQLPYNAGSNFEVNSNGFTLQNIALSNLQSVYTPITLNTQGNYINSTNYIDRQNKLYCVNSNEYYIYLLQDQKIDTMQIYDVYNNGKDYSDTTGVALPNFEIPYYQMQYYYTFNDLFSVNLYQMATLDNSHKEQANQKLLDLGAKSITQNKDWKYSYCDSNETLNDRFEFNIYWYRNILNVELNNLLENKNSFNGYALITENEKVTASLQEHYKYNLVIYIKNQDVYEYTIYSFNDINLLKTSGKYQYKDLAELFVDYGVEELGNRGIIKQKSNVVSIYFGNTFTIQAVDQSKDHSMDEFIGYRFNNYDYQITADNCSSINELNRFANDGINYTVEIDLQNYEHDYNGNTTNYFNDKDVLSVDVNFDKIVYIFRYQVVDVNNTLDNKYGNIKFSHKQDAVERYQFEYFATIDNDNVLSSRMNVRLGSELLEWRLVNDIISSHKLTESQLCEIFLNATFLRNMLYLNISGKPASQYPSTARQSIGDVNAVCGDIAFEIKVNVKDLREETIIRNYILSDSEQNKLFTIKNENQTNVNTVSIDNEYVIKMLTKQANDTHLYYYQDGNQYVVRGLYIAYSLAHSTNMLVNEFAYPVTSLEDIEMSVNHSLLDGIINYTQYIEVSPENRYLNFYIEVAPVVQIEFEVKSNEYDKFKESRQLSLGNIIVAKAEDGQELEIQTSYIGYWGQDTIFNFVASENYYSNARLSEDYSDEQLADKEFSINVNSNIKYTVTNDAKIIIELLPKLYNFNAVIEYDGNQFSASQFAEVINSSGINIFDTAKGIVIKADKNNIDPINGVYYYGDKLLVNYNFNEVLKNDFSMSIYLNNSKLYYNYQQSAYIAQFLGKDLELRFVVLPKTDEVVLTTNLPDYNVASIYAQINDGDMVMVQDATSTESYKSFTLINGDKLNVYIKPRVGFEFTGTYEYDNNAVEVVQGFADGNYEQYIKITLFEEGFMLANAGWYYLIFEQLPIEIQFKYYVVSPIIEEDVNAGSGYMANCSDNIIQENSVITLTQGTDNQGYRFDSYSYGSPKGNNDSKQFELTTIDETQQQFTINEEILSYLESVAYVDNKLPLVIYINYIKQYKFDFVYECEYDMVVATVLDKDANKLVEEKYYDYSTELTIKIQSTDTKHYQVQVELDNGIEIELIDTSTINGVGVVECSIITTNVGNLAGFAIERNLINNYIITIDTIVEKYDTILHQNLYKQVEVSEEPQSVNLQSKDEQYFNLYENIYYQVKASHEYLTEVEVNIFVLKPINQGNQYYTIADAYLNDSKLTISYMGEHELNTMEGYLYSFKYRLIGEDLPTELKLDINFKALYYLQMK